MSIISNIKENSIFASILGLISFSTILPVGNAVRLETTARMFWLWPVVHFFVGILAYIVAIICSDLFNLPALLVGAIVYGFILIFTGLHHLDGLMDMADGVMVHGDFNRKMNVMKDPITGVAGIASFFIVAIITLLGITYSVNNNFLVAIIICEMASKVSLLTTCISSNPYSHGTGALTIRSINIINYSVSLIIALILAFIVGGFNGLIGIFGGVLGGAIISIIARRSFRVANGDVLGASNEFGRMTSLLLMIISICVML
ncbi:adenosylcobinamide-GDP ribazoletransferase [Methanobrevibacter sp. DSM 116169]|uniref:adenosylcobinamide-GDP ribazoletransferase n=1 Tax=Methanobrevibacter sp. DSM 116169 TaxID=3242727 RepID=UPI0038FC3456